MSTIFQLPISINASVGNGGSNLPEDVRKIQYALNGIDECDGGSSEWLKPDGLCGSKTKSAILRFQKENKGLPQDGRIDPNRVTLERINKIFIEYSQFSSTNSAKMLALKDKDLSREWVKEALDSLTPFKSLSNLYQILTRSPSKVFEALSTHFHLSFSDPSVLTHLQTIISNYENIIKVFDYKANDVFFSRKNWEAQIYFDPKKGLPPAFVFYNESINFVDSVYKPWNGTDGWGPMCRAAMVLHEAVHYVDKSADVNNDFYEHSNEYLTMTREQAIHNPSSYVCFAQQIIYGITDPKKMYGAGNPKK